MGNDSAPEKKTHIEYEAELRAANEVVYKHSLELARLKQELEKSNIKQENLLHFISHEVKGYLTRSAAAFSGIAEGDYGAITPDTKKLADAALAETRKGIETVMDILDAGNFKKGTLKLAHEPFDFRASVEKTVASFKPAATDKHLSLYVSIEDGGHGESETGAGHPVSAAYTVIGDETQMRKHVIGNLIDNAIRYTPQGRIVVKLKESGGKILFSVTDSGVGITQEDMKHLFTEGGRGAESVKINVHSTGFGLFIAKSIVGLHGGRIWAESEGTDKGSTFFVELPAAAA
jgi:signal transduction histidine kinase